MSEITLHTPLRTILDNLARGGAFAYDCTVNDEPVRVSFARSNPSSTTHPYSSSKHVRIHAHFHPVGERRERAAMPRLSVKLSVELHAEREKLAEPFGMHVAKAYARGVDITSDVSAKGTRAKVCDDLQQGTLGDVVTAVIRVARRARELVLVAQGAIPTQPQATLLSALLVDGTVRITGPAGKSLEKCLVANWLSEKSTSNAYRRNVTAELTPEGIEALRRASDKWKLDLDTTDLGRQGKRNAAERELNAAVEEALRHERATTENARRLLDDALSEVRSLANAGLVTPQQFADATQRLSSAYYTHHTTTAALTASRAQARRRLESTYITEEIAQ